MMIISELLVQLGMNKEEDLPYVFYHDVDKINIDDTRLKIIQEEDGTVYLTITDNNEENDAEFGFILNEQTIRLIASFLSALIKR